MTGTPSTNATPAWLWRWRPNPVRRHSDVVEAWIVSVIWALALFGGVLAGVVAAHGTDSALTDRRAQVHPVSAVLTDDAARTPPAGADNDNGRVWVTVRWTGADGAVHTGLAKIFQGAPVGTRLTVWTDRAGRIVSPPADGTEATLQAVLTGALVAPLTGATVWAGGRLIRSRLLRRRLAEWDEEWKRIGPEWRNLSGGQG
ncbi:hypothetical protein ACIQ6V_21955 [Streptomyces sp. NPDC096198]|uniref:Rv1733c family protein n=1 Tax=Streptomyces sp. NPDC096198 TaxID=3366080 RepID=UPI00380343DB